MHPFRQSTAAVYVLGRRVGGPGAEGWDSGLQDQPLGVGLQVVDTGRPCLVPLVDGGGIDGDGLPQKLGDVRPGEGADYIAAKKASSSDFSADDRAAEGGERSEEHTSELQSLRHLVC